MKRFILIAGLIFVGVAGWRIGDRLSSDAIGMGIGVLFGIMAGIPAALLVLAANRRRADEEMPRGQGQGRFAANGYGSFPPPQPPVIVLAGHAAPAPLSAQQGYAGYDPQTRYALPGPREPMEERRFKVVGEKEEWIEEW